MISTKPVYILLILPPKTNKVAVNGKILYTLCISKMTLKNSLEKIWRIT